MDVSQDADSLALRRAFACFPTGVLAVCGVRAGEPVGIAANSFASVSLRPPLVSICVANASKTWPALRQISQLGMSVLSDRHRDLCRALAGPAGSRFRDARYHAPRDTGPVFIHGASLWLTGEIEQEIPAGDHNIVVLRALVERAAPEVTPLLFHRSSYPTLVHGA
jgi:flavin reductase (DIM6/NTAB) family NADH-FMN oxidoreductase RutF